MLPGFVDVCRSPVETDSVVLLRLDRIAGTLIQPEPHLAFVQHAADQPAVIIHLSLLVENPSPSTHRRRVFLRSALGMIGTHDSTGIATSLRHTSKIFIVGNFRIPYSARKASTGFTAAVRLDGM